MNETLRDNFWEYFPDLIFYDSPVSDDSIIGLALLFDQDFCWSVVYDENLVLNSLVEQFSDSEDPETEALEYYNFNILGGYIGSSTPIFMHDFEDNECVASRFSRMFDNYITLENLSHLNHAFEVVKNENTFLFVPSNQLDKIKDIL